MAGFLFIGGCERSGTTLLQRMLLSHPHFSGGPEFMFSGQVARLYHAMTAPLPEAHEKRRRAYFEVGAAEQRIREFYGAFFKKFSDEPGVRWVVEKTPSNIFVAEHLLKLFPDAQFVGLMRDARAVARSWRDVQRRARTHGGIEQVQPSSLRHLCTRWNRAVRIQSQLSQSNDRFHSLRFESLISDPMTALEPVLMALEVDASQSAVDPQATDFSDRVDDVWWTEEMNQSPVNPARAEAWRGRLGFLDRIKVQILCGRDLAAAGYPIPSLAVSVSRALHALAGR